MQQGDPDLAKALKALESAVLADTANNKAGCDELLEILETVVEGASTPAERRKLAVLKAMLESLKNTAWAGPEIGKAFEA